MLRRWARLVSGIALAWLTAMTVGCANFEATKAFAAHGQQITTSVKSEFEFIAAQCRQGSTVTALLTGQTDPVAVARQARADCQGTDDSLARLSRATLDLLDQYDQAIAELSNGSQYDLSGAFKTTADKLKALEDKNGALIRGESVDVALRTANLLSDIATSAVRSRDMKRLLDAGGDDWPRILSPLKTFFGPHAGNMSVQPGPYQNIMTALNETDEAIAAMLGRKLAEGKGCISLSLQAVECEPLRATELMFDTRTRQQQFIDRISVDPARPSKTAQAVQDAIDAWLQAHEALRQSAFREDGARIWASLLSLKTDADALAAAIKAARED